MFVVGGEATIGRRLSTEARVVAPWARWRRCASVSVTSGTRAARPRTGTAPGISRKDLFLLLAEALRALEPALIRGDFSSLVGGDGR